MRLRTELCKAAMAVGILVLMSYGAAQAQDNSQGTSSMSQSQSAQSTTDNSSNSSKPVEYGGYVIHQSFEFGYRDTNITGNQENYDTFVNLGSGLRLLNQSLDMHSLNHNGLLFDDLSLSSFGYGGDPQNVTRLHVDKYRWYNFSGLFRRDKNFWNYNLLANPLNPTNSNPEVPIDYALHGEDLSHRMSDYDLTLLPQSRVSFRLGYSYNVEDGPSLSTYHGPTDTQTAQIWKTTGHSYRFGFDFKMLPRTVFSYDQFLQYYKQDTSYFDVNQLYQVGTLPPTPVDLGVDFNTLGRTPCASPILDPTTSPQTANPTCNAYVTYSRVGRPRVSIPTEQFRFQSDYFRKLDMTGRVAYTSEDNSINDFSELFTGNTSRTLQQASTAAGPASGKRINVGVDWAGTYSITNKLRIVNSFHYESFRDPGLWNFGETSLFASAPLVNGTTGTLLQPPGQFNTTDCPPPFTANTCPQHNTSSGADLENGLYMTYLGQDLKQDTIQVEYDFTRRFGAHLGYRYGNRKITDFNALYYNYETFYPGPSTTPAFRGDCTLQSDGTLPPGCTANSDGSVTFSGLSATSDTTRNETPIHEYSALFGFWLIPTDKLRLNYDMELFYADHSFTRISPRQLQDYKVHGSYNPLHWLSFDGIVDIQENRDNVDTVENLAHNRYYSFTTALVPNDRFSFDLGYTYNTIYTQTEVCYSVGSSTPPVGSEPCPITDSPVGLGSLSYYDNSTHFVYGDLMWKPLKRVTTMVGYAGSFVHGNTLFLNPLTPYGPLAFNYQKPYARLSVALTNRWTYNTAWNYYGYNLKSPPNSTDLAPIGGQDFNGNLLTVSMRYAF